MKETEQKASYYFADGPGSSISYGSRPANLPIDRIVNIPVAKASPFYILGIALPYLEEPLPLVTREEKEQINRETLKKKDYLYCNTELSQEEALKKATEEAKKNVVSLRKKKLEQQQAKNELIQNHFPNLVKSLFDADDVKVKMFSKPEDIVLNQFGNYAQAVEHFKETISPNFESPSVFLYKGYMFPAINIKRDIGMVVNNFLKKKLVVIEALDKFLFMSVHKYLGSNDRDYKDIIAQLVSR